MIVISGALVLVALVLLVLGLTMQDLNFVYGSIAVSLISFVFLVIGILQRRGDSSAGGASDAPPVSEGDAPADSADPAREGTPSAEPVRAASLGGGGRSTAVVDDAPEGDVDEEYELVGAVVLVVPGRPRYHVDGCRYLAGKSVEEVEVDEARAQYSPCGVCKPDDALEELAYEDDGELEDIYVDDPIDDEAVEDEVVDTGVPGAGDLDEGEPAPAPRRGGSRKVSTATTSRTSARDEPAAKPAKAAKAAKPAKAPAKASSKAPATSPAADAPSKGRRRTTAKELAEVTPAVTTTSAAETASAAAPAKAAKPARRGGRVVVIPDRDRFHTSDCRFVRSASGTEELTRAQADKQGFRACGVCKP
ncbi:MAG TPA: hypothetical protein VM433_04450 [Mycobacteriales bacterium]|nr:hypothetical protein [Mycobacteriales bacterium]